MKLTCYECSGGTCSIDGTKEKWHNKYKWKCDSCGYEYWAEFGDDEIKKVTTPFGGYEYMRMTFQDHKKNFVYIRKKGDEKFGKISPSAFKKKYAEYLIN